MKRMNVRTFRNEFSRATEPVEVLKGTQTLGLFIPGWAVNDKVLALLAVKKSIEKEK